MSSSEIDQIFRKRYKIWPVQWIGLSSEETLFKFAKATIYLLSTILECP